MKTRSSRCAATALAAFLLFVGGRAQSATPLFEPISQERWLINRADITVKGVDGASATDSTYRNRPLQPATNFFTSYDVVDVISLDVVSPDGTASAHIEDSASHSSFIGPDTLRFEGSLDSFWPSAGAPGTSITGGIGIVDLMDFAFQTTSPLQVALTVHGHVWQVAGSFAFALSNLGGDLIYRATTAGNTDLSDSATFVIAPGQYSFVARLNAGGPFGFEVNGGVELRLAAVTAVAEPETWAFLLLGLPCVGGLTRRAHRLRSCDARV